jgi:hypothetical protein
MVLHPRQPQTTLSTTTTTASTASFSRVVSPPTHKPFAFNDANRYEAWHSVMREEIQVLRTDGADICYLLIYVDDILLTGNNSLLLQLLIQLLSSEFNLRNLGIVYYFLGTKVQSTGMGLMLRHHKYTFNILTWVGMLSCKPVNTLISTSKATILSDSLFF